MGRRIIPYGRQLLEEDDLNAVMQVLRSDWLTQGPTIEQFESELAAYCRAPHAIAVSHGTAALHLACMALEVGPGDRVWTSPLSFVASANCARYLSAEIDFVDVDPVTGNMAIPALQAKLEAAAQAGRLPKVIIPVHYTGRACDMTAIAALKQRYGFKVIEDAAHALGGHYADGTPVGGGSSEAVVFSFHPVKSVTTGEGGAVVTRDSALAQKMRMLRTHGITRDASQMQQKDMPHWYYEQHLLGCNYRLTDIQAALGISQMQKLDRFIALRRAKAEQYDHALKDMPLILPPLEARSAWHLYVVQLDVARTSISRNALVEALMAQGIGVGIHYMPIHLQPYYRALGFEPGSFPQSEAFSQRCLSLPLYPALSEIDQEYVIAILKGILS